MTLAIFGATGGLGRAVVQVALEHGHRVRAHTRSPDKLPAADGLEPIEGDLGHPPSLQEAVSGADAVLWCAGFSKGEEPAMYGRAMAEVVGAMQDEGIRRIVAISGAGLELEGDETGVGRSLVVGALKLFAGKVLEGKEAEWQALRHSDVDWTLVRAPRMVAGEQKGEVEVHPHKVSGRPTVAYADVAAWMIDQVEDEGWIRQAPFVSGA